MNRSPQFTLPRRSRAEPPRAQRACNIVTFYEDFAGAIRASGVFDSLAEKFGAGRPVNATSWSFAMLGNPELNAAVVMDAALADVLVVAAKGDSELPPRIAAWVEMCINTSGTARPVLVALHDDGIESDGAAAPLCSSVEGIAARKGAAFLCNSALSGRAERTCAIEPADDEERSSVTVLEKSPGLSAASHRWWGIND